jgi:hypothetical protein
MHQPNVLLPVSPGAARNIPSRHFNTYGMGWNLWDYQGRKVITHGGGLDGMISRTAMMPEENLGMVILTNSENSVPTVMSFKIFDVFTNAPERDWSAEMLEGSKRADAAAAENEKKLEEDRVKGTSPSLSLEGYAGTYTDEMYGDAEVAVENGKLVLRLKPAPNFVADLEHWNYDTFRIRWRPSVAYNFPTGFVTFKLDKNGKTDDLLIDQPNNDFWFYELHFNRKKD